MTDVVVKIFRINKAAKLPTYATAGSVGLDLQTMRGFMLEPGETLRVSTGVAFAIPDGWEGQIRPRSGVSGRGLLVNLGTVDADYRGEVMLNVVNVGRQRFGAEALERLAQIVFKPAPRVVLNEVESLEELGATARGSQGFGSTGRL